VRSDLKTSARRVEFFRSVAAVFTIDPGNKTGSCGKNWNDLLKSILWKDSGSVTIDFEIRAPGLTTKGFTGSTRRWASPYGAR
jgi:hypothetical protein